ncbi:unnamed protein product, partial [Coccothraustes coccothraustes]
KWAKPPPPPVSPTRRRANPPPPCSGGTSWRHRNLDREWSRNHTRAEADSETPRCHQAPGRHKERAALPPPRRPRWARQGESSPPTLQSRPEPGGLHPLDSGSSNSPSSVTEAEGAPWELRGLQTPDALKSNAHFIHGNNSDPISTVQSSKRASIRRDPRSDQASGRNACAGTEKKPCSLAHQYSCTKSLQETETCFFSRTDLQTSNATASSSGRTEEAITTRTASKAPKRKEK